MICTWYDKKYFFLGLFAGISLVLVSCQTNQTTEVKVGESDLPPANDRIRLEFQEGDSMVLHAFVPNLDNRRFTMVLPKMIGCYEMTMVNHRANIVNWTEPDENGSITGIGDGGVLLRYEMELTPHEDYIDVDFELLNLTRYKWTRAFFFTFLAPLGAPDFTDKERQRTFIQVDGKVTPLCDIDQKIDGHTDQLLYILHENTEKEPHVAERTRCTSSTRSDGNWMIQVNETGDAYIALAVDEPVFLFNNDEISSLHVAPCLGDLAPDEVKTARLRMYMAKGTLEDALKRIREDF